MTPEKAFLVRVFVDHCVSTKENNRLEKVLPVVTAHAFRIQEAYNTLLDVLDGAEIGGDDEAVDEHEFILAELLRIASNLDYADEIGRRRLEQFVRMYCIYFICGKFVKTPFGRTYDIAGSSTFRARHTVLRRSAHCLQASEILYGSSSKLCMTCAMRMIMIKSSSVPPHILDRIRPV